MQHNRIDSPEKDGVGAYEAGLGRNREAVVSSHFMHAMNLDGSKKAYGAEDFAAQAIHMTPQDVMIRLIPELKKASRKVVEQRSEAAADRARQNYAQYGLASAKEVGTAEIITEAITDRNFRKTNISDEDRRDFRDRIARRIEKGEPIEIVAPMLPNKVACPLKTRGTLPGLAEAGLIARLGEIAGIVDALYPTGKLKPGRRGANFIIVADGRRFKNSWNTPEEVIVEYQKGLQWWIDKLGLTETVSLMDYEHIMTRMLSPEAQKERGDSHKDAMKTLSSALDPLLDVNHLKTSLEAVVAADPFTEDANPEGRFVPLFKSTLYNIRYPALDLYTKKFGEDYVGLYRELTRNIETTFASLDEAGSDRVANYLQHGRKGQAGAPPLHEIKEYLRRSMIAEAWESAKDYLAIVIADRELETDPVTQSMPDVIRFSIHSKPGQIGLKTTSENGDPVQAWHGEGHLRFSGKGKKLKLGNQAVLELETEGNRPVLVREPEGRPDDPDCLMSRFARCDQPLFYMHPDLGAYDPVALAEEMSNKFVRI